MASSVQKLNSESVACRISGHAKRLSPIKKPITKTVSRKLPGPAKGIFAYRSDGSGR